MGALLLHKDRIPPHSKWYKQKNFSFRTNHCFNSVVSPPDLSLRENDGVEQTINPSELTFNMKHGEHGLMTFGGDLQNATYKTHSEAGGIKTVGSDVRAYSTGLFLQEKYVVGKWVFRAGGRRNNTHHTYELLSGLAPEKTASSWKKNLWSVGTRYNYRPKIAFYGNMGTSFVTPTAKQLSGTIKSSDAGVAGINGQLPNFQLMPETGIGSDLGADLRLTETLSLNIRGFLNQVKDAIVENIVSVQPSQTRSVNAGKGISRGCEIDVEDKVNEKLSWFGNWTYTATRVENSLDQDQNDIEISFVPKYVANLGLTLKCPKKVMVSPYFQFIGEYFDSISKKNRIRFQPYQVLNLKLQKKFLDTADHSVSGIIDLNNITNKKYEMPWQFGNPGFNFFGSLEMMF
ncbi:MAG: TonB-dependent receptor [Candidatus Ozemobacteraceae bacterium]